MITQIFRPLRTAVLALAALTPLANAWADGNPADRTQAFGYQFTEAELDSFPQKTNLPTVYLQVYKTNYDAATDATTFALDAQGKGQLESLETVFGKKNEWYYFTKITIRDDHGTIKERNEWTGVRGRGNATWNQWESKKKPLRLKFPKKTDLLTTKVDGAEVNNHANAKSWTLLANHYDATLIRNAMTNELGQFVGMEFCPAYKFVDLVVNNTYMGTYQISDHVQVDPKRVPINEKTGYFVEAITDKMDGFLEDPYLEIPYGGGNFYMNVKSPDPDVATANGPSTDPKYMGLKDHISKIAQLAFNGPWTENGGWRDYVDLPLAVNAFIALELTGDYDGTQANCYAYIDDLNSKLKFGPLWDFDLAWGNLCNGRNMSTLHFWEGEYTPVGALCAKVFQSDPYFVKAVYERWTELMGQGLEQFLSGKADELAALISQSAALNYSQETGENLNKGWADGNNYSDLASTYTVMKNFIANHVDWMETTFKAQYDKLGCASLNHTHDYSSYMAQDDGTYRRACSGCGEADPAGLTYYRFTVYPESAKAETVYATSWQPDGEHPNAVASVNVTPGLEANIQGYNIYNNTKDEAGNQECPDFRLTDGHPYYGPNKFVATKAHYTRSVKNDWGTIVLPYKYQVAETEEASFYHIKAVEQTAEGPMLLLELIDPTVDGNASAYTPVVFKRQNDAVTAVNVDGENVTVKKTSGSYTKTTAEGWTLVGVMEQTVFNVTDEAFAGKDIYYISNNKFWHATGKLTNNPFRAYIEHAASGSEPAVKALGIGVANSDDITAVDGIPAADAVAVFIDHGALEVVVPHDMDVTVHALSGALVARKSVKAGGKVRIELPAGIYVVNGVKVII